MRITKALSKTDKQLPMDPSTLATRIERLLKSLKYDLLRLKKIALRGDIKRETGNVTKLETIPAVTLKELLVRNAMIQKKAELKNVSEIHSASTVTNEEGLKIIN